MFLEQATLIILDDNSAKCMANNCKDTKHTRYISRRMHLVRNDKECNFHKTVWCKGGLQLAYIGTKNFREYELNTILGYIMVRLDN